MIWEIVFPLISLLLFAILYPIIVYIGAKYNLFQFTFVEEGTIKTVVAGSKFVRFIPNIKGYHYNPTNCKIEPGDGPKNWFTELTGLYVTSWIYPLRSIFTFDIPAMKLREDRSAIVKIEDKVRRYSKIVDNLRWKIDRPFVLIDVDLIDGTRVNLLGRGIYTVWDPYRLLFELQADFFNPLDTLIAGYAVKKLKTISIDQFRSDASAQLEPAELTGSYDIKSVIGLESKSLVVEEWSISSEDPEMQAALQAEKIAEKKASATRITAEAEKYKRRTQKEGDAEGDQAILKVYAEAKLTPEVAKIFANREIKELRGTLVEAGSRNVGVMVTPQPTEQAPNTETSVQQPAQTSDQPEQVPPQKRKGKK